MSELQDKIDAENRQAKRDKARADRAKKVEAVREYITGKVNNVRNKVENARIQAEKRAEERRDRQDFAADSESTYQAYMDEATHMTQVETRETVAEGVEKHTVQTENGPIVYIEDKSWDAKDHPHREYKGAYRGFTEINVNGVKQKVFVSFDVENEEMYDYGPHGDYTSGPKQILRGFMRNANGSYSKIDVDIIDKYGMVGKGSISKEQAKEIYTGITTAYKSRMAELHPENESSTEGM